MKNLLYLFLATLALISCSPRVVSHVLKSFPALPETAPVEVYIHPALVPAESEAIGEVKVADTGFTLVCDSVTVINLVKTETRKIGGNAVLITKHSRPSFWGSSCHQMIGTALKVYDFVPVDSVKSAKVDSAYFISKPARKLPRFAFDLSGGYGWRTAKIDPSLNSSQHEIAKALSHGWITQASAYYYFNDNYGIGLMYSAYLSNHSIKGYITDENHNYIPATDKYSAPIRFIGPIFAMRLPLKNEKWIFNYNLGLGYIGYVSKETLLGEWEKFSGSNVGFYMDFGADYRFAKHWGVGAKAIFVGGTLGKLNYENSFGDRETIEFADDYREGLGQFLLTAGVRFYIP